MWELRYGKRVPAVVVDFLEVPKAHQRDINSRKVNIAYIQMSFDSNNIKGWCTSGG